MDSLKELVKYQESVIESLEQENEKWTEGTSVIDLQQHLKQAQHYCQKLFKLQQDIRAIQDKTNNMKKRAAKLHSYMERQALDMEQRRQRQQDTDKKLSPIITISDASPLSPMTGAAAASSRPATSVADSGTPSTSRPFRS